MTRPRCNCKIGFHPKFRHFRPFGPRGDLSRRAKVHGLGIVEITLEEAEALRLKNIKDLDQTTAAEKMKISQSTFQRLLTSAYKKVSDALITGKTLKIVDRED